MSVILITGPIDVEMLDAIRAATPAWADAVTVDPGGREIETQYAHRIPLSAIGDLVVSRVDVIPLDPDREQYSDTLVELVADGRVITSRRDIGGTDTDRLIDVLEGRAPDVDLADVLDDPAEWWDPTDPDAGLTDLVVA